MTPEVPAPLDAAEPRTSFPTATDPRGPVDEMVADLHFFLDEGRPPAERGGPPRTIELATSLCERLTALAADGGDHAATLSQRIVTDELLRAEADRDQNVYLGELFTRRLTRALPDLVFLPATVTEVQETLRWAAEREVAVTLRGAASTALGGSVPNDGGLTLDLSHLAHVDVAGDTVCVIGAGARLRTIHRLLADRGLALPAYPSNLGATFAGWLVTGGVGLNAFGPGSALDVVLAADIVLPSGELVRFHADGRLDVPGEGAHHRHRELGADEAEAWFRQRRLIPFGLADLAGSEGVLGVVVQLVLAVGRRPRIGAFLLSFAARDDALRASAWISQASGAALPRPANLKLVLGSYLRQARRVWADEDSRPWRRQPSELSGGAHMPWRSIAGPEAFGVAAAGERDAADREAPGACLYVDFLDEGSARAFATRLAKVPGAPLVLGEESVRFAAERFRPQQNKRLGPGLLAAEVRLPAADVPAYLGEAEALARGAGLELDPEVYFVAGGDALVIAGYLTDHRRASFHLDLVLAPALLDLAIRRHRGRPYVLGRWQASFAADKFGEAGLERLRALKAGLDPENLLNRGVLLDFDLRGAAGTTVRHAYRPGVSFARAIWRRRGLNALGRAARAAAGALPGPARGRGEPLPHIALPDVRPSHAGSPDVPLSHAIHCVNCGECNAVCPVFDSSAIRLPQTLTHHGELVHAGRRAAPATAALLDLCMRCGNCEEVCQAGIPHLEMYARMETAVDEVAPYDFERHARALVSVRGSSGYRNEFLRVRPGMYLRRTPAALPGALRFRVLRAESEAGPAATCLHCAACVPACPTAAHREFESDDARLVTTDEASCIGCGACVEVCPANRRNGGQTLRVLELPTFEWLTALGDFERTVD